MGEVGGLLGVNTAALTLTEKSLQLKLSLQFFCSQKIGGKSISRTKEPK